MSIEKAAIVPHPPILIPSIGKENLLLLPKTTASYKKLAESLKEKNIETVIVISSHGNLDQNNFNINESEDLNINFEEFGDYTAKKTLKCDKELIAFLKQGFSAYQKVKFINSPKTDHGSGVPIYCLTTELPKIKMILIYISSELSLKEHFNFGKKLKNILKTYNKKTAIIASGDLSHTITKKAPAGYSPRAARFDQKLTEYIQNKKIAEILNLDQKLINEVKPCGLKSIAIILGVLKDENYEIKNLTYESPFGIGYLAIEMEMI